MSYAARIKAAPNPQAALVVVGEGIDALLRALESRPVDDPWAWPGADPPQPDIHGGDLVTVEEDENGDVIVKLAEVSPEKYEKRKKFADQQLQLGSHIPVAEGDICHAYGVGGPLWLYTGNRDLFMSYPVGTIKAMIADIMEDDHVTADEVARDVLKDKSAGELPDFGGAE